MRSHSIINPLYIFYIVCIKSIISPNWVKFFKCDISTWITVLTVYELRAQITFIYFPWSKCECDAVNIVWSLWTLWGEIRVCLGAYIWILWKKALEKRRSRATALHRATYRSGKIPHPKIALFKNLFMTLSEHLLKPNARLFHVRK